jgi:hypothetical protein
VPHTSLCASKAWLIFPGSNSRGFTYIRVLRSRNCSRASPQGAWRKKTRPGRYVLGA